ncbi:SpoIIE family protein phosphatase [Persicobacter psychrovividus]|uniref:Response regulatory domain-containing protein n=1 Tax=Persicobacter psychrovividus TaxID=387638 RepID=A0ABM7VLJ3_9BACT|nr:hypothetical protein PEPS_41340 [Persicobacter psychrovividus]
MNISQIEFDVAKEVINIGLAKAADAMSMFVADKIKLKDFNLSIERVSPRMRVSKKQGEQVTVLTTAIKGQMQGVCFFILNQQEREQLLLKTLPSSLNPESEEAKAMGKAFLMELDNIIAASVVTQFSNLLELQMHGYVPEHDVYTEDELNPALCERLGVNSHLMYFKVILHFEEADISPEFIWSLDAKFMDSVNTFICNPQNQRIFKRVKDNLEQERVSRLNASVNEKMKFVLIDDSTVALAMLTELIESCGHEVISTFQTGEQFLQNEEKVFKSADLIIMDINLMGDLNGIQTMSYYREKYKTPFMYITAHDQYDVLQIAKRTLPWAFLTKPLDIKSLRNQLELFQYNHHAMQSEQEGINEEISRLKEENHSLATKAEMLQISIQELTTTNEHLISATFREREMKEELAELLKLLEETKSTLEVQNSKITESIQYSYRIQQALNTNSDRFKGYFNQSFIFYQPKDVVSGDFPWALKMGDYLYVAAVDCTGHGVPGAMLAIMTNVILKYLCTDISHTTNQILDLLHLEIVDLLQQECEKVKINDGLDISLVRFNTKTNHLQFSGAHLPMFLQQEGTLQMIRGDKMPVGGTQYKNRKPFKAHDFDLKPGDRVFIFSDGLVDQFGESTNRKFGRKQTFDALQDGAAKSLKELENNFISQWKNWQGGAKQIDDVLLIGIEYAT